MELLLNILWLMLAVPAAWLWFRDAACAQSSRRLGGLRLVLLLACILVLLFPTISATDDLHAMRPELEESSISKRTLKACCGEKSHSSLSGVNASPVLGLNFQSWGHGFSIHGSVVTDSSPRPRAVAHEYRAVRSPPFYQLS